MIYKESYWKLCHGTTEDVANDIRKNGFLQSESPDNWCGSGVYFYDIKAKAWWAAKRKCEEIRKITGKKRNADVVFADILDLDKHKIFDLRIYEDICAFEAFVNHILETTPLKIEIPSDDDNNNIVKIRAMFISFFAKEKEKELVIGNFLQKPQAAHKQAVEFSGKLDLVFGIETIYCVKNLSILKNIT